MVGVCLNASQLHSATKQSYMQTSIVVRGHDPIADCSARHLERDLEGRRLKTRTQIYTHVKSWTQIKKRRKKCKTCSLLTSSAGTLYCAKRFACVVRSCWRPYSIGPTSDTPTSVARSASRTARTKFLPPASCTYVRNESVATFPPLFLFASSNAMNIQIQARMCEN